MFYETKSNQHGLPHDPYLSCIVPRPIGWITTLDRDGGLNLAPFSFFNGVASNPRQVMFGAGNQHVEGGVTDTQKNAEDTGEFVANMVTWEVRDQMNVTSEHVARSDTRRNRLNTIKAPTARNREAIWENSTRAKSSSKIPNRPSSCPSRPSKCSGRGGGGKSRYRVRSSNVKPMSRCIRSSNVMHTLQCAVSIPRPRRRRRASARSRREHPAPAP